MDIKPTALLMHITYLSGSSYVAMERAIFLNRLPSEVRTILSNSGHDELRPREGGQHRTC